MLLTPIGRIVVQLKFVAGLDRFEPEVEHERHGQPVDSHTEFHQIRRNDPLFAGGHILSRSYVTVTDPAIGRVICGYHREPTFRAFGENLNGDVPIRGYAGYIRSTEQIRGLCQIVIAGTVSHVQRASAGVQY